MTIQSKSSRRIPQSSLKVAARLAAAASAAAILATGEYSSINNGAAAGIIIGADAFNAHRSTIPTVAARPIRPAATAGSLVANIGGGNAPFLAAGMAPTAAAPAAKSRSARTASAASSASSSSAAAAVVLRAFRTDNEQQQQQQQQEETAEDATIDATSASTQPPTAAATATTKDSNGAMKNGVNGAIDDIITTTTSSAAATAAAPTGGFELVPSPELAAKQAAAEAASAAQESNPLSSLFWRGVVVALCALWASNFAAAKLVMSEPGVDSSLYAVSRFTVAALALLPGTLNAVRRNPNVVDIETIRSAAVCGSWVAFGYLGQTLGLLTTTASRSCVICSLHCVFVAIVAEVWRANRAREFGRMGKSTKFDLKRLIPAIIAVTGVAIVELQGAAGGPGVGDALSVAQPIGFGMGYLQLEEIMAKKPEAALPVSAIKLLVVATASMGMFELSPLLHTGDAGFADALSNLSLQIPDFGAILSSPLALGGILYTGLITTALALWIESIAFARVPATDASIILTTEPIFAAGAGAVTLGETFGMSDYVGASLIVGACVLATLMDVPGDEQCEVGSDGAMLGECEPPKQWPTGGGGGGF